MGTKDTGKTSTIKRFYEQLKFNYPTVEEIYSNEDEVGDIQKILKVNRVKIGIESQGDPDSRLPESLEYFSKEECDIIVCATRTRGGTVDEVVGLAELGYEIIWFSNLLSYQKNEKVLNFESARILFNVFEKVLNGVY